VASDEVVNGKATSGKWQNNKQATKLQEQKKLKS
jgi:hypothetical protein